MAISSLTRDDEFLRLCDAAARNRFHVNDQHERSCQEDRVFSLRRWNEGT